MKSSNKDEPEILLITSRNDLAADLLTIELNRIANNFVRLNIEDFPADICISWIPLSEKTLLLNKEFYQLRNIKSAWYRKSPSAVLPTDFSSNSVKEFVLRNVCAFLEGFWESSEWFWLNKPSRVQYAENKLLQLKIAKKMGIPIPRTLITNNPTLVREFIETHKSVVTKPITSPVVHLDNSYWGVFTHVVSSQDIEDTSVKISPCIFQERIKKKSDLRITVIGKKVFAAEITTDDSESDNPDWRAIDNKFLKYKTFPVTPKLENFCIEFLEYLGLAYGAFDFILDKNDEVLFLEVNPSGQWGWIEHETGLPITRAIAELLIKGYT